jgi:hypothetical protein
MDKIDIINKYRTSIDKNRIEGIWNDIYSVNKVIRYQKSVGEIVDMICMNVVKMMELENQFRSIKYDLDRLTNRNREIRLSGVGYLKGENKLEDYIKTLDDDERNSVVRFDLGVNGIVNEIKLEEFKSRQKSFANSYSITNG